MTLAAPVPVSRREAALVALLVMAWLGATAWVRPLMLPDEGRYVGVAWEMLHSGDWLTPTLNGLPFFHKPPLFYWITAGAMGVFGLNEWAGRAAPLVGAWLAAVAIYAFARRWADQRTARATLVALLCQPLLFVGGQFANLDMLVAGCISATIVLLADAALCLDQGLPARGALAGAWAMGALGVLAKGLIGAVIPALVIVVWLLLWRRWRLIFSLLWWPAMLLFALIAVPWFVAMQNRFPGFFDYFFVVQHFKRFAAGGFNNVQPFWFYPVLLVLASLPWLPWLFKALLRGLRDGDLQQRAVRLLMLVWAGAVVLFFSLPQSKLVGYVLPAVPPLAFLAAVGWAVLTPASTVSRRLWWAGSGVAALLGLGVVLGLGMWPRESSRELAAVLAARLRPGEPVLMLNHFAYDLPFYARLRGPVTVVDHWSDPTLTQRDNWRKELVDAGQFAPALAAQTLIEPTAVRAALCLSPVSWVVSGGEAAEPAYLAATEPVFRHGRRALWRVDAARPAVAKALGCPERPNAD